MQEKYRSRTATDGPYYAQSLPLNEQSEGIAEEFEALNADIDVETYRFWVDPPFYNYLNGESL